MSHEQSGLGLALLAHDGDQVQLEDDVVGVVGLELVVVLNLEYGNLLRGIDNSEGARGGGRAPPEFGRSVNPIQIRGQIMPLTLLQAPQDSKSYLHL